MRETSNSSRVFTDSGINFKIENLLEINSSQISVMIKLFIINI